MSRKMMEFYAGENEALKEKGLFKNERIIQSPQNAVIELQDGRKVLNFCANNYLGLANKHRTYRVRKGRPGSLRLWPVISKVYMRNPDHTPSTRN